MSAEWISRVMGRPTPADPAARLLLLILADVVNGTIVPNGFSTSIDHLSRTTAMGSETIKALLRDLQTQGFIAVHPEAFTPGATCIRGEIYAINCQTGRQTWSQN